MHDLLGLDIDAGDYLPLDTKSANFDNIADAQLLSPTVMQGYLTAAAEISRLAVGDRGRDGARGDLPGVALDLAARAGRGRAVRHARRPGGDHTFPADGQYRFRVSFYHETTGALYGNGRAALHTAAAPEQVEIAVDGERVALLDLDRWMNSADPDGVNLRTEPIAITAGPHTRVGGVPHPLRRAGAGPDHAARVVDCQHQHRRRLRLHDAAAPARHGDHRAVRGDRRVGDAEPAQDLRLPPQSPAQQTQCAHTIVTALASQAFRRTATERDVNALDGALPPGRGRGRVRRRRADGARRHPGQPALRVPLRGAPGERPRRAGLCLSDVDLASRLSFFLWAAGPDAELLRVAEAGRLSRPGELERQVRRMLADRRSDVLASRFAAQWLRLPDLDKINPDVRFYPDVDEQLKGSMRRETETFFQHIVRADRPVLDLFAADYTFVDERLARHYGIPGVIGPEMRRVVYPDPERRGVLGHASILTLTSEAERTSPVLRGKWVMEVLLATPPPPPPPNIPALDETADAADGRLRTVRERMEEHRRNPACMSCHRMIDPIGLALENFDVTGAWRIKDNGSPIDPASTLYDGTPLASAADLQQALMKRSGVLVQTFTENLMTYALGRRLEASDMPAVRGVVRQAAAADSRFSAFVLSIVQTPAFRMKAADGGPTTTAPAAQQ